MNDGSSAKLPVVSLLVPLFKEEQIAENLVARLSRLRYPTVLLDICLVTETDDLVTLTALKNAELPPWFRIVRVPHGSVRTKPRALNYALDFCRGKIVGVYDAEDEPEPSQIEKVVDRFQRSAPEVACLQGRLAFYNSRKTFLTRCFSIDYASWFSVVLPGIARLGLVVPLGGTTLFFRRAVLDELGAWDAHNVTEDADLGLRLARRGYRTELIDTTTREEATLAPWAWIKQRSRWLKGYAMTYAVHMRDPGQLRRDLGWRGFLGVQTMFLGTLVQAALAPVLWSWWLLLFGLPHPLGGHVSFYVLSGCTALMVLVELLTLFVGALALRRTKQTRLLLWLPIMNIYNMMTTVAVGKALLEMVTRPFYWDKTQHGRSKSMTLHDT